MPDRTDLRSAPSGAKKVPPRAVKRPRDFQRSRLYRWEAACILMLDLKPLSLMACRTLVAEVFVDRLGPDVPPPDVEDGRGRRHAAGSRLAIKLPRWARRRSIVLHECAHGLSTDGHGPDFVRTYLDLLVDFMGFERARLEESLAVHRLKVTRPGTTIAVPALPRPAPVGIPHRLARRLAAIGIRTLTELRESGPIATWVRLKQRFGRTVTPASLLTLAAWQSNRPAAAFDGRTRAQLKFEAMGNLIAANRQQRD